MLTSAWTKLRYHAKQNALWYCPKRLVAVPAGRGSGKTELARRRLVRLLPVAKPWPDARYFFAGPTLKHCKELAWEQLQALIPPSWVPEPMPQRNTIMCRFATHEARIVLVGLNDKKRSDIEGFQWDGGVIDESCDIAPGVFGRIVMPALMHRDGWCWRIGVPKRQGIGAAEYRQFFEEAVAGLIPDATGFTWPSGDILPPEAIAILQRTLDPKDFQEQVMACFETAGGGIFYTFDRAYNVRPCEYHADKVLVVSCDFNVDPMAWVVGHRWPERIEWIDEIFLRDTNTQQALDALWGRYGTHESGFEFYGDATSAARKTSAAYSDYQQIANDPRFRGRGRTIHFPSENPPVADRFAATNAMLLNAAGERRMHVDPGCVELIKDLESRYYLPGTREPADPAGTDMGHITDAAGYAVFALFPIRVELETGVPEVTITTGA